MKTAVSIPDELHRRADEFARRQGKSRSEVYRDALTDFLARRDSSAVTSALDELEDGLRGDFQGFGAAAAEAVLRRSEW